FLPELLELSQRRLASQLDNHIVPRLGDDEVLAYGPAALRDNAPHANGALEQNTNRPLFPNLVSDHEPAIARPSAATRHAPHHSQARMALIHVLQEQIGRK